MTVNFYMFGSLMKKRIFSKQNIKAVAGGVMWRLCRKMNNHCIPHVRATRARYFVSEEEREILDCCLDFHEISESPKKMRKPIN